MLLEELWVTQRQLRRIDQIPVLMTVPVFDTKIELQRCPDNEVEVVNGHHRLVALWLLGRRKLNRDEFILKEVDEGKHRVGRLKRLVA